MHRSEVDLAVDAAGGDVAEVVGKAGEPGHVREHTEQEVGEVAGDLVTGGLPRGLRPGYRQRVTGEGRLQ